MEKKLFICALFVFAIGALSCKSKQKDVQKDNTEYASKVGNSRNSLDWEGLYTGILPCADCSGIQVSLELLKNQTFKLRQVYMDEDDTGIDSSGEIVWDKDGACITLAGVEDMSQFAVFENMLIMLDQKGHVITGELAEHYILAKVDPNLITKY